MSIRYRLKNTVLISKRHLQNYRDVGDYKHLDAILNPHIEPSTRKAPYGVIGADLTQIHDLDTVGQSKACLVRKALPLADSNFDN